jgi:hypothetical protein
MDTACLMGIATGKLLLILAGNTPHLPVTCLNLNIASIIRRLITGEQAVRLS